jgi:hypothetical protein
MKRSFPLGSVLAAAVVALPASAASATMIELGATKTPLTAPACPPKVTPVQCKIVLTRATAIETVRDGLAYPTTVTKAGRIVAFTVGLSNLSSNRATRLSEIKFLDNRYRDPACACGTAQVAVTVLRPVGSKKLRQWRVVAQSTAFHVQPYLGEVVQLPLVTTLPVSPGEVVAVTSPTWAPVLSIDVPTSKFAYRQSRTANCPNPPGSSQAQQTIGATARYLCDYPGTRVEYSATEIMTPPYPKNYVHSRRHARRH